MATTAPGHTFTSRSDLATHYKSDWHRYNLKRKEAGMPCLDKPTFDKRVAAAKALKAEREERAKRGGSDHLKGLDKEERKDTQETLKSKKVS